jgi:hypothetical protein
MIAEAVVNALLEGIDAKAFLTRDDFDGSSNKAAMHLPMYDVEGAARRSGEGYEDQWEIWYKDWLFVLSVYEDGTQIWSAHYKTKPLTPRQLARGYGLSGGGDPQRLPPGSDPKVYLARLKKMADLHPAADIWKSRRIPYMPDPKGPQQWRGNY